MNYTTPTMNKLVKALARRILDAGDDLEKVQAIAHGVAPKVFGPVLQPTKAADLLADAFLIVKDGR